MKQKNQDVSHSGNLFMWPVTCILNKKKNLIGASERAYTSEKRAAYPKIEPCVIGKNRVASQLTGADPDIWVWGLHPNLEKA